MITAAVNDLTLVVKVAERCNINCTYCYIFNTGNQEYRSSPPIITDTALEGLASFIGDAIETHGVSVVNVVLHGGEPLLIKHDRFDEMCTTLRAVCHARAATLHLVLQTNAMLVSDAWIGLFEKHRVGVGISIDGPREFNDAVRVDHKGRGTYYRVEQGVRLLMRAASQGRILPPGVIFVVNTQIDPEHLLKTMIDDLGFRNLKFLLPEFTPGERGPTADVEREWVSRLTQVFLDRNDPTLTMQGVSEIMQQLCGTMVALEAGGAASSAARVILSVSTDGRLGLDDSLRSVYSDGVLTDLSVIRNNLSEYLAHERVCLHRLHANQAPDVCTSCCWHNVCFRSDDLHLRVGADGSLDNPSVNCSTNKARFQILSRYLLSNGVSRTTILEALAHN